MLRVAERALARIRALWGGGDDPLVGEGVLDVMGGVGAVSAIEEMAGTMWPPEGRSAADAWAFGTGMALSGERAACWLDGPGLHAAAGRIARAVGARVPLVGHVVCRGGGASPASGGGHGAWHQALDHGAFALFASSAQEAADLALVARMVAERGLVPGLLAQDPAETAFSLQDVRLLPPAQVAELLGVPEAHIVSPDAAQRHVFGDTRRLVPRQADLEAPAMHGATQGPEAWAVGAAARRFHAHEPLGALLDAAYAEVASATGRPLGPLARHGSGEVVVVAQGALVELARAAGCPVVGLRQLRPWPAEALRTALAPARVVLVLERADTPLAGGGPLTRELREVVGGRALVTVTCGLGGRPVRAGQLAALVRAAATDALPAQLFLGLDPMPAWGRGPHRQARLDALKADFPGLASRGWTASDEEPETLALGVVPGLPGLTEGLARLLHGIRGGSLRSLSSPHGLRQLDVVASLPDGGTWPGQGVRLQLVVAPAVVPGPWVAQRLAVGGTLLVGTGEADPVVPEATRQALAARRVTVLAVPRGDAPVATLCGAVAARLDLADTEALAKAWVATRPQLDEAGQAREAAAALLGHGGTRELALAPASEAPGAVPLVLDAFADHDGAVSLPRFWHQVGALYRDGATGELVPEPDRAFDTIPPLSAALRDRGEGNLRRPRWDPAACEACGSCWTACPDGALGPLAIRPDALLGATSAEIGRRGGSAGALRPVVGKVSKRMMRAVREGASGSTGAILREALAPVVEKLPEARRDAAAAAGAQLAELLDDLPVAGTGPLLEEPEAQQPGTGQLFHLVLHPEACKDCGACVAACDHHALARSAHDPVELDRARRAWQLWERLPDTPGDTLAALAARDDHDPLSPLSMSRHAATVLGGGDEAEPGSGEKLVLRLALAAGESLRQPALVRHRDQVRKQAATLRSAQQDSWGHAVRVSGDELEAQLERPSLPPAERKRVLALGGQAEALESLAERLGAGLGRARVGVLLASGVAARGLATHPHNAFATPVVVDDLEGVAGLAEGLVLGQIRRAAEDFVTLACGEQALKGPVRRPERRGWDALSARERAVVAPLLVVGDDRLLSAPGLADLLATGLPVKLLVLGRVDDRGPSELELLALGHARATTAQSSPGDAAHLADCLRAFWRVEGPAVLRVLAPSPEREGFPSGEVLARTRRAVALGLWPLWRYVPAGELGSDLSLDEAPEVDVHTWAADSGWAGRDLTRLAARRGATHRLLRELAGEGSSLVERLRLEARAEADAALDARRAELDAGLADTLAAARRETEQELTLRLRDSLLRLAGHDPGVS